MRNHTDLEPGNGNPWSSDGLRGVPAARRRALRLEPSSDPQPRSERDGNWLIGTGMASAGYPMAMFMPVQWARARIFADGSAIAQTATQEIGTGIPRWRPRSRHALGVELRDVRVQVGDTGLPGTRLGRRVEGRDDGQRGRAPRRHRGARPADRDGRRRPEGRRCTAPTPPRSPRPAGG